MHINVEGFNVVNRSSWDFELFADMYIKNLKFQKVDNYLGAFRIYPGTLTGSKDKTVSIKNHRRMFKKYFTREFNLVDNIFTKFFYLFVKLLNIKFYTKLITDYFKSKKQIKVD